MRQLRIDEPFAFGLEGFSMRVVSHWHVPVQYDFQNFTSAIRL